MLGSVALPSSSPSPSSSTLFFDSTNTVDPCRARPPRSVVLCNAHRSSDSIPKLEPFSRSRIDRCIKEPSFIQKSENDLKEYCSTLEGDDSHSCWRAYFELKDLEKELSKDDVDKFVRQCGGLKSLIDCLHGITAMQKKNNKNLQNSQASSVDMQKVRSCPIPDGLPKTREELEEEEKSRMPDSPFTRLLRSKGRFPAWYSQAPDHETD